MLVIYFHAAQLSLLGKARPQGWENRGATPLHPEVPTGYSAQGAHSAQVWWSLLVSVLAVLVCAGRETRKTWELIFYVLR